MVALPDQLFYNTGISTYFWVVTNRKSPKRRGKVQLIDARESWTKMRKSLGNKRKQISEDQIAELTRLYGAFEEGPRVKIFPYESFGFLRITVERPLQLRWEIADDTRSLRSPSTKRSPSCRFRSAICSLTSSGQTTVPTTTPRRPSKQSSRMRSCR